MPFGIPYLYDEEERRRLAMTPGINPNAPNVALPRRPLPAPPLPEMPRTMPGLPPSSPLPEVPTPTMSLPTRGRPDVLPGPPGGMAPFDPPSRYTQLQAEKEGYLRGAPGRGKSGIKGALRGFVQGLGTGQGLGAGLGGAIAGAAGGAINPRGLREMEFEERERPKLYERWSFEDADRAAQAGAAKAAADQTMTRMQLANIESQIQDRTMAGRRADEELAFKRGQPTILNPGQGIIRRGEDKPVFTMPMAEKAPTTAELTVEPSSGKGFEQIAEESYQGRGGDQYVFDRLPERTRQLITGQIRDAAPAEIEAANRAYQTAIDRERKSILDYTRGDVRGRALGAKKGGSSAKPVQRKGQPGRRVISVADAAELLK